MCYAISAIAVRYDHLHSFFCRYFEESLAVAKSVIALRKFTGEIVSASIDFGYATFNGRHTEIRSGVII